MGMSGLPFRTLNSGDAERLRHAATESVHASNTRAELERRMHSGSSSSISTSSSSSSSSNSNSNSGVIEISNAVRAGAIQDPQSLCLRAFGDIHTQVVAVVSQSPHPESEKENKLLELENARGQVRKALLDGSHDQHKKAMTSVNAASLAMPAMSTSPRTTVRAWNDMMDDVDQDPAAKLTPQKWSRNPI